MKLTRSTRHHFKKWLTNSKKHTIQEFLTEFHWVVCFAVDRFQAEICQGMSKKQLLLACELAKCPSWLTARAKKNAYAEAWALVKGTWESCQKLKVPYSTPRHDPKRAMLSSTNVSIQRNPKLAGHDLLVELRCFDGRVRAKSVAIPLRETAPSRKWASLGSELCTSVILTPDSVQLCWELSVGKEHEGGVLGLDPGAKALLTTDTGDTYGTEMWRLLAKLRRKVRRSAAWYRCKEEIREYVDLTCKSLPWNRLGLVVLEDNRQIQQGRKQKAQAKFRQGRKAMSAAMRSVLSGWIVGRVDTRIQLLSEENGVSLRRALAFNNSITCPDCGHREKANRVSQDVFTCRACGSTRHADQVGAVNSLARVALGPYGAEWQSSFLTKHPYYCRDIWGEKN